MKPQALRTRKASWAGILLLLTVGTAWNLSGFSKADSLSGLRGSNRFSRSNDMKLRRLALLRKGSSLSPVRRPTATGWLTQLQQPSRVTEQDGSVNTPIFMTYLARSGLCNQLLAHLNALALAHYINATLILSQARSRNETSVLQPKFTRLPTDALLDVHKMVPYWQQQGLTIQKSVDGLGDCMLVDIWRGLVSSIPDFEFTVSEAAGMLSTNVSAQLRARQLEGQDRPPCIHIYAANIFHLLDQRRSIPYLYPAAQGLFYNPQVLEAAQQVLRTLRAKGHTSFWGAHLRLEGDWAMASHYSQGVRPYVEAMERGTFNSTAAVYIASGVFSYWNSSAVSGMERELKESGVMGSMHHKGSLLEPSVLQGFNLEQQALIDMHVLVEAEEFVGHPWSTFACYVRELRAMRGVPRSTFRSIFQQLEQRYFFGPETAA